MDPLSIAATIGGLTCTCLTIAKKLCDIVGKYRGVSQLVNCIHSEAKIIGFSLSQLQSLLLDDLDEAILNHEVREALDISLTGCAVAFSCLKNEIAALVERLESETRDFGVDDKVGVVWREERFKELLDQLRGQHGALGVLLQCLQMKSLFEVRRILASNQAATQEVAAQTRSLRGLYPKVKVANSLLEASSEIDSDFYGSPSVSIDSEKEFEFDDIVTNSQVYRRVLIQKLEQERREVDRLGDRFEEDLIDLDLVLVDLSEEVEAEVEVKQGSFLNDLELLMLPTGKDEVEGGSSGLDMPSVDDDGTITLCPTETKPLESETNIQHREAMATDQIPALLSSVDIYDNPPEHSDGSSSPAPDIKSVTCTPKDPPVSVQEVEKFNPARDVPNQGKRRERPTTPPSKPVVIRKSILKSSQSIRPEFPNNLTSNIVNKPKVLETTKKTGGKPADSSKPVDTRTSFPHAFERWETLSAHWEGLTSFWIRILEDNSNEINRDPLSQQLSQQVTDLSAAGANLFHAMVALQRLRASSERKFQRFFSETKAEQEHAQALQRFNESELEKERSKVQQLEQINKNLQSELEGLRGYVRKPTLRRARSRNLPSEPLS